MKGHMFKIALAGVGLALFGASATFAKTPTHPASRQTDKSDHVLRSCDAHKFETVVEELVDGQPHKSTVKLCGKEGQTDAQWIGTLKDAIAKLKLNPQMPEAVKNQIITALNSEIGRLSTIGAFHPQSSQAFNSLGSAGTRFNRSTKTRAVAAIENFRGLSLAPAALFQLDIRIAAAASASLGAATGICSASTAPDCTAAPNPRARVGFRRSGGLLSDAKDVLHVRHSWNRDRRAMHRLYSRYAPYGSRRGGSSYGDEPQVCSRR